MFFFRRDAETIFRCQKHHRVQSRPENAAKKMLKIQTSTFSTSLQIEKMKTHTNTWLNSLCMA